MLTRGKQLSFGLRKEVEVRSLRVGSNVTVFLVFFGIAFLEAMQAGHWPAVILWLAVGAVFLRADNLTSRHS